MRIQDNEVDSAIHEAVRIVPHDPAWSRMFEAERDRLMSRFGDRIVEIRHFGSTAVPGLAAKPVVDLIAGVRSLEVMDVLIAELIRFGYHYSASGNEGFVAHRWLFRQAAGHRTHHLHLVEYGGTAWQDRLRFCAALRDDADLCRRYEALKRELVERHAGERHRYTAEKFRFIQQAIGKDCG